jgi:integrase
MKYAKGIWRDDDPSVAVEPPKPAIKGHHTWTDDEIRQYRKLHRSGTRERMAFELLLWSGARRGDAVRLGRQNLHQGALTYTQNKTGVTVTIPVQPEFAAELALMPRTQMLFMVTVWGKAHSEKAFGAWFKKTCKAAGLPSRCVGHGLRKARARILAEAGATASQIAAWTGHRTLTEVQHYTDEADRAKMARKAGRLEQESTLFQKRGKAQ